MFDDEANFTGLGSKDCTYFTNEVIISSEFFDFVADFEIDHNILHALLPLRLTALGSPRLRARSIMPMTPPRDRLQRAAIAIAVSPLAQRFNIFSWSFTTGPRGPVGLTNAGGLNLIGGTQRCGVLFSGHAGGR